MDINAKAGKKEKNEYVSSEKFREVPSGFVYFFISYIFQCKVEKEIKRISIPIKSTKDIFFLIKKSVGT